MLGKLMKYEWKGIGKFGSALILAIFVITGIGYVFLRASAIGDLLVGEAVLTGLETTTLVLSGVGSLILYYLALLGVVYGAMIYMGVRFYKTMYTGQGYLTHTLPVTPGQLLTSKILISGVWYLLVSVSVIISVFILLWGLCQGMFDGLPGEMSLAEIWGELSLAYQEMGINVTGFVITIIMFGLLTPFTTMIQIFGALTIGQLAKKYKLMVGIFTYIGLIVLNYIVTMVMESIIMITTMFSSDGTVGLGYMNTTYIAGGIYTIVVSVVLVFVSHWIIKKKLNLN